MVSFNFGPRAERFAMRPPEKDWTINILEGAVRSGKTWCLHPKDYQWRLRRKTAETRVKRARRRFSLVQLADEISRKAGLFRIFQE